MAVGGQGEVLSFSGKILEQDYVALLDGILVEHAVEDGKTSFHTAADRLRTDTVAKLLAVALALDRHDLADEELLSVGLKAGDVGEAGDLIIVVNLLDD